MNNNIYFDIYKYIKTCIKKYIISSYIIYIMPGKYEYMTDEQIIENYKRNKEKERARNKQSYLKLQEDTEKYFNRLNNAYINQVERLDEIKNDDVRMQQLKEQRRLINRRAYIKRTMLQQKQQE